MNDYIAKGCPPGYRFLVQLVDAETAADAHATINQMFGNRYSSCACYRAGTNKMVRNEHGQIASPLRWEQVESGFRVYVPKEFQL